MPYESDRSKSRIIWVDLPRAVAAGKHVMARGSRLTALDSLRGFGILLVVWGHTSRSAGLVSCIFHSTCHCSSSSQTCCSTKDNSSTRLRRRLQDISYRICSSE